MSKNLERVIQRAISDAAFRRQLQSNPEAALRGFKLTNDEVAALRSGDAGKLTSLGIDQRMSKTFTFGAADLASRASTGGDLTSAGMSHTDQGARLNSAATPGDGGGTGSAVVTENTVSAGQVVIPGVGGGAASIGDPMSGGIAASNIGDPDNPASARGYVGEQTASGTTSDALEDQSHAIAARHFGEAASSGLAAPIEGTPEEYSFRDQASVANASITADPDNPASARGYVGDPATASRSADVGGSNTGYGANYPEHGGLAGQSADVSSSARGSVIGDPDNPANARGYVGDQAGAPTADALEDQSHAIAARQFGEATSSGLAAPIEGTPEEFSFRDQAASTNASITADPDNPAFARGFIGDQSDAFLSEGEVSRYSADPNLSSGQAVDGQAVDEGQLYNSNASDAIPDDDDIVSVHREPDQPA